MKQPFNIISSTENAKFKYVKSLLTVARSRKKTSQSVLEGTHLIQSYLDKGGEAVQIFLSVSAQENEEVISILSRSLNTPILMLDDPLYKQLRNVGTGVNILAVIETPAYELEAIKNDALILNDIQDAGNVGTLLRTAAAVGINHIICTSGTASVWSPKCLRAGMGAQFSLTMYENVAITDIHSSVHVDLLATSSHTDNVIYKQNLTKPVAWIVGNEGQGVCEELMQHATHISLPQPNGEESLNVGVAGALCMYEMLRQRSYNA